MDKDKEKTYKKKKRLGENIRPVVKYSLGTVKRHLDLSYTRWEDPLEERMATPSNVLAWEIPRTEEPGRLPSKGWERVGHNLATKQQQKHT